MIGQSRHARTFFVGAIGRTQDDLVQGGYPYRFQSQQSIRPWTPVLTQSWAVYGRKAWEGRPYAERCAAVLYGTLLQSNDTDHSIGPFFPIVLLP